MLSDECCGKHFFLNAGRKVFDRNQARHKKKSHTKPTRHQADEKRHHLGLELGQPSQKRTTTRKPPIMTQQSLRRNSRENGTMKRRETKHADLIGAEERGTGSSSEKPSHRSLSPVMDQRTWGKIGPR
ncbi:hypothetical protein BDBG_17585 [Blastomyces gilchristii SLH14081]|uniref:Uncharacterized protein n=1 Tax=Blastomyces gilchristii (strain SLH14081) TaxID=559298 RepID=A0A179UUP6_BLAGS|nr:uncharacterized protein BDBG_17585 [Blastomyces gilchristii SLH14081]OAT11846.1 hypothetical protein BDBG_17585 [Blastomyces gilchristii SLH14081]